MIIDKSRWPVLSPLLDELLDLDGAARAERLAALRADDAALADELQRLLERDAELADSAFLAAPALERPAGLAGQRIGPYTLERELGAGGMGSVWLARRSDGRYDGKVAIKFLQAGLFGRAALDAQGGRFAREGQILARLAHPHIARLIDAGVAPEGQQPYLVLEYIDGVAIDHWCDQQQLDLTARVRLLLDVLAAVAHAHNRLILHRDLKPSNILVNRAGEAKLLDFGIAKLLDDAHRGGEATELTQRAGAAYTPRYAAPEQVQGGEVTTATDVYALGVLMYGLFGGGHPTTPAGATTTAMERLRGVVETEPRRLSEAVPQAQARALRGDLDTIVAKALKKAPAERYANADALADDLRRWLQHEPITARPDSRTYRIAKFVRRNRIGVAAGALVLVSLGAGLGLALWQADEARRQREQAEGLIEFMLGDLRGKLQPVGRLDALDGVGAKALAYYAAQSPDRLDADALGRRARAMQLLGEIAEKRGKVEDAARLFRAAADSTGALLARAPLDGQRLFDHAQSTYWLGYVARLRGRRDEVERQFQAYLALAERLDAVDTTHPAWRLERGFANHNLGIARLDADRPAEALVALQTASDTFRGLLAAVPAARLELITTLGWIGAAHERLGHYDDAIAAQRERIALLGDMSASEDVKVRRLLASAWSDMGLLQLSRNDAEGAARSYAVATDQLAQLVARDASNLDFVGRLAFARIAMAVTAGLRGDAAAMRPLLDAAEADLARLLAADPRKLQWQLQLRATLALARESWAQKAAPATPPTALQDTLAAAERVQAEGARLDPLVRRVLADVELALGDRLAREGRQADARRLWAAALARQQVDGADTHPRVLTQRAHLLLRLGRTQEARALADTVEASAYRAPMAVELFRRLAAMR